jgi:acyl-CoA synthetase (AMP-forming)/AMP-acid ligase II
VLEAEEALAERIAAEVPGRVRDEVGVVVSAVTCVPRGSIPKTSSGKLRRAETRQRWLDGTLQPEPTGRTAELLAVTRQLGRSVASQLRSRRS